MELETKFWKGKKFSEEHKKKISKSHKGKQGPNKGKKFSEEHKKKLSESHIGTPSGMKGKYLSEETKRKMSESRKGRPVWNEGLHLSENHKKKLSEIKKGKHYSEETKIKMSLSRMGEKSPRWMGGISFEPYCEIFSSNEFKEMIKERDHHQCQNCGTTRMLSLKVFSRDLTIHHINYIKKDCKPKNLITTCISCNTKANSNREFWQTFYNVIISKNYLGETK